MESIGTVNLRRPRHNAPKRAQGPNLQIEALEDRTLLSGGLGDQSQAAPFDSQPPNLPSNLAATGITSSAIRLSWTNGNQPGGYYVERSTDAGWHWTTISGRLTSGTGFTDSGRPAFTNYSYRLTTGGSDTTVTAAVNGATLGALAAPSHLAAGMVSTTQILVTWYSAANATGHVVERSLDGTVFNQVATVGGTVENFTDGNLTPGMTYYYRVKAVRQVDVPNESPNVESSAYTSVGHAATLPTLVAPSGLQIQAVTTTQAYLRWTASTDPTVGAYQVQRSTNGTNYTTLATVYGNASYTDDTLTPNQQYYYRINGVRQFLAAGSPPTSVIDYSSWSGAVNTRTLPTLSAPTNVSATVEGSDQVLVQWTNPTGASVTSFKVEVSLDGVNFTQAGTTSGSVTQFTDSGRSPDLLYYYRVSAIRQVNLPVGGPLIETQVAAVVHTTLPGITVPSGLQIQATTPWQSFVRWNASTDPDFFDYQLQRSTDGTNYTTIATLYGASSNSYADYGLNPNQQYYYRVNATRRYLVTGATDWTSETSAWSGSVNARTLPILVPPTNVTAAATAPDQVLVRWTNPTGSSVTNFQIWRSLNGVTFTQIGTTPAGTTQYTDAGLLPAQRGGLYQVVAYRQVVLPVGGPLTESQAADPVQATVQTTVLTVGSLSDSGPGSLRDAINTAHDGDTIVFAVTGTVWLRSELLINKNITIVGPGAGNLTVSGGSAVRDFEIMWQKTVAISGLTIADGATPDVGIFSPGGNTAGSGAGISNSGYLTVDACVLTNDGASTYAGGAIYNIMDLWLTNSVVVGNWAPAGGGIFNDKDANVDAATWIANSTIAGNNGYSWGGGGVFSTAGGTLAITGSTISGNIGPLGGGIFSAGTLTLIASTVTGNATTQLGGGICNQGTLAVISCTIAGNAGSLGGGIYEETTAGTTGPLTLQNTIVAGNWGPAGFDDIHGPVVASSDHNLIGVNLALTGLSNGSNGNKVGTTASPIDPKLGALQDNGGPTWTMALLQGSPALNAGSGATAAGADQNGNLRGSQVSIGAVDYAATTVDHFVLWANDFVAGVATAVTIEAVDLFGNPVLNYAGTVHFTSTDGYASLPANYHFTAADQGVHTFTNVVLWIPGVTTITVTDTASSSRRGTVDVTVG